MHSHSLSHVQLCNPLDCSPPNSSVSWTSQARILEWVAISSSRESSPPRDWSLTSFIGRLFTAEPPRGPISSVQSLSRVRLLATSWTAACQASLFLTSSWSLPRLMFIESLMSSNHLILSRPLLLPPSILPSIRVFSKELVLCIRWPNYWSFSFSINPSNEYSGLISFRMDWLDLLAVQGTLKSLLQHHSSKASLLQCSAFFIVQMLHPDMTTGKDIALNR